MKRETLAGAVIVALVLNLYLHWGASYYGKAPEREGVQSTPTGQTTRTEEEPSKKASEETRKEGAGTNEIKRTNVEKRTTNTTTKWGNHRAGAGDRETRAGDRSAPKSLGKSEVDHEPLDREFYERKAKERQAANESTPAGNIRSGELPSRSSSLYRNLGTFEVTAYTAGFESTGKRPGHPSYGVTATGTTVKEGRTIAADWSILPPGTVVKIVGLDGYYTVEDRGSAIKGNIIDLYIEDLTTALAWGRQERIIYVKEWGEQPK